MFFNRLEAISGFNQGASPDDIARLIRSGSRPAVLLGWLHGEAGASAPLTAALRETAARELIMSGWLSDALALLASAEVPALVIKGASISQRWYPEPWLRPRNDDDLLVPEATFDRACEALREGGYRETPQNPGAGQMGQAHFVRAIPHGGSHFVDLHARPLVPGAFRTLPGFDDLAADAQPLPGIGPHARGPSGPLTMLLGCAHRVAHHSPTEDPTWLVDVHLLAGRFAPGDWTQLCEWAERSRMAQVCAAELSRAVAAFDTEVPAEVIARLGAARGEPSAAYLQVRGPLHAHWVDFRHQRTIGARLRFVAGHLAPPPSFMRARFGPVPAYRLPWLYVQRAAGGLARWVIDFARRRLGG